MITGVATVVVIPKAEYKKFFIYSLIFGGLAYIAINLVISPVLHLAKYINMGPFGIYELFSYWTPISYTFVFMFFLYFLPDTKAFFYPYLLAFSIFGYCLGIMLENFNVFHYLGIWLYTAPIGLFVWFWIVALIYMKNERIKLK